MLRRSVQRRPAALAAAVLAGMLLLGDAAAPVLAQNETPTPGAAGAQRPRPAQQRRQPARPATPPAAAAAAGDGTRIPPPGPAEVPLFPAREYTDQRSGLAFTVPAGWLVIEVPEVPEGEVTRMFMEGPGLPAPNCAIVVTRPQQPPRATQAALNRVILDDRSVASVRQQLAQQGRRVVNVRKLTLTGVGGLSAQVTIPGATHSPELTTYVSFFEQVGKRYSINCSALSLDLDTMRPDIDAILRSLRFPTG